MCVSIILYFMKCFFFFFFVLLPADLEKMNSLERISFLQEKLQDIRNHYLSLKSEVASIDRRRKRMKKKERESESAVFTPSSALLSMERGSILKMNEGRS